MDTSAHVHLRRQLDGVPASYLWPQGVSPMAFDAGRHAAEVHALLEHAHRDGSGVAPFEVWWQALRGDAEYDPALVFLAVDPDGRVIGVAQCWTSTFVKDLAVVGHWRRRGIGERC